MVIESATPNIQFNLGGMIMGAEWITHRGKRILYIKYSGLKSQEMLDLVMQATQMILYEKSNQVLTLSDLTNCYTGQEFMDLSKKQGMISLPLTKKAAVVGVTGLKEILFKAVNSVAPNPRKTFDTVEEALDWLAK